MAPTFERCRDSRPRRKHTHSSIASSALVLVKLARTERCTGSTRSYDDTGDLMSASTTAMASSTSVYTTRGFWERLWRLSGINFVAFAIIAYVIYGYQPPVAASADALAAFYDGHRTRILIAAAFSR